METSGGQFTDSSRANPDNCFLISINGKYIGLFLFVFLPFDIKVTEVILIKSNKVSLRHAGGYVKGSNSPLASRISFFFCFLLFVRIVMGKTTLPIIFLHGNYLFALRLSFLVLSVKD